MRRTQKSDAAYVAPPSSSRDLKPRERGGKAINMLSKHFIPIKKVKGDDLLHKSPYQLLQEMQQENELLLNDEEKCLEIIKSDTFKINDSLIQKSKSVRRRLLNDWNKLGESERASLRSQRSRMGVKCSVCGLVGYYREMCSNGCPTPPSSPDSDATPPSSSRGKEKGRRDDGPGLGFLWNETNIEEDVDVKVENAPPKRGIDIGALRPLMLDEKEKLRQRDGDIGIFEFFTRADEGYSRTLPELTLHHLMRRIMRQIEMLIWQNVQKLEDVFDVTLLHPPSTKEQGKFYPEELNKVVEYQDLFYSYILKLDKKKTHRFKSSLRPPDALDPIFRGGSVADDTLYLPDPEAGQSLHAKVGWKSVTARFDQLAVSDPNQIAKMKKIKELFKKQGEWKRLQQKDMEFRNDMFDFFVTVLRMEMENEHKREVSLVTARTKSEQKYYDINVWQERFKAVDRIQHTLHAFRLGGALDDADYLNHSLEKWKDVSRRAIQDRQSKVPGEYYNPDVNKKKKKQKKSKAATSSSGAGSFAFDGISPYELQIDVINSSLRARGKKRIDYKKSSDTKGRDNDKNNNSTGTLMQSAIIRTGNAADEDDDDESILSNENDKVDSSLPQKTAFREIPNYFQSTTYKNINQSLSEDSIGAISSLVTEARNDTMTYRKNVAIAKKKEDNLKWRPVKLKLVPAEKQQDIDDRDMREMKSFYLTANLKQNIRKGEKSDVAYLAPTLIPVPGAFKGDGKDPMISHTAEHIVSDVQKRMVLGDIGYTPQRLLPLYVRNTLLEKNGTSSGGDQTQDVMAMDRRYSHTLGRPLNRFEMDKDNVVAGFGDIKTKSATNALGLADVDPVEKQMKAESAAKRRAERRKQMIDATNATGMTSSLVKMVFGKPPPTLQDLYFQDDL